MSETRFHRALRERITDEVDRFVESLLSGAAPDYPTYRQGVGYLNGLRAAAKLADDIDADLAAGG
jgi:hypothetical protein